MDQQGLRDQPGHIRRHENNNNCNAGHEKKRLRFSRDAKTYRDARNKVDDRISMKPTVKIPIVIGGQTKRFPLQADDIVYVDSSGSQDACGVIVDIWYDKVAKAGRVRLRILVPVSDVDGIIDTIPKHVDGIPVFCTSNRVIVLASARSVQRMRPVQNATILDATPIQGDPPELWFADGVYAEYIPTKKTSRVQKKDAYIMSDSASELCLGGKFRYVDPTSIECLHDYLAKNYFTTVPPYASLSREERAQEKATVAAVDGGASMDDDSLSSSLTDTRAHDLAKKCIDVIEQEFDRLSREGNVDAMDQYAAAINAATKRDKHSTTTV